MCWVLCVGCGWCEGVGEDWLVCVSYDVYSVFLFIGIVIREKIGNIFVMYVVNFELYLEWFLLFNFEVFLKVIEFLFVVGCI